MKKILIAAAFAALIFSGCNDSSGGSRNTPLPPQPIQPEPQPPVIIQPIPDEPDNAVPDVGTGSVQYSPSCTSGFATVQYVYQSGSSIDSNSFLVIHMVNGKSESITQGSVTSNGSVSYMKEDIYIKANDGDDDIAHQVQVKFVSDGVSQVDTFSFMQPSCDVMVPVEPVVDPVEPVVEPEPIPEPNGPAEPYAPNKAYNVGDIVTVVDANGVTRTYICNTAYISGFQGTWTQFKKELVNWTRIANMSIMKVNIV